MVKRLVYPLEPDDVSNLKTGDVVEFTGILVTARDKAHQRIIQLYENEKKPPVDLTNGAIIHCGPIAEKTDGKWRIISAGPTTSYRMEDYTADLIRYSGLKLIIGKGGMGEKTADACKRYGAIYCSFTGGAGLVAAERIRDVKEVFWLDELGMAEALWVFEVEEFGPLVVTIDSEGNNLSRQIINNAKIRMSSTLE